MIVIIKLIGKEHAIFYKIVLSSYLTGKNWIVYHSFQEFNDLYLIYQKLFLDVPTINWTNSKTIIKEPIIHRQLISQLNDFINIYFLKSDKKNNNKIWNN